VRVFEFDGGSTSTTPGTALSCHRSLSDDLDPEDGRCGKWCIPLTVEVEGVVDIELVKKRGSLSKGALR
jgi:hypothetical protein